MNDIILSAEGLSKEFSGFLAVKNVSLSVRRGSIHALIGPNGAGKTTYFNMLSKFQEPTAGRIIYNGRDITRMKPAEVARLGLVRSFQISAVFGRMTALENVRVALQRKLGTTFHFWRSQNSLNALNDKAMHHLETVGLADAHSIQAAMLPYGHKRALELATTLALNPEMMLLDEPMAGLTHGDIDRITELIREAAHNRTVLLVEHNLSVVATLSDTITVLTRGEILAEGPYSEVSQDPRVMEAYMGAPSDAA